MKYGFPSAHIFKLVDLQYVFRLILCCAFYILVQRNPKPATPEYMLSCNTPGSAAEHSENKNSPFHIG